MAWLESLSSQLSDLDGRAATISVHSPELDVPDQTIDRIHEGLLRKQRRSGSLGLNE